MRTALLALVWLVPASQALAGVEFERADQRIMISVDGRPFTVYRHGESTTKPFFWPILGPNGAAVTRNFPNAEKEGEAKDHPWHRGLSFTHGEVDVEGRKSVDFWAEGVAVQGRIVHRSFDPAPSVRAGVLTFGTRDVWQAPDGATLVQDHAFWQVDDLGRGSVRIALVIELKAGDKAVRFGDTKEGSFAVRVATDLDEVSEPTGLRARSPRGKVVDSQGVVGANQLWGKPSDWVDYSGRSGGEAVGIAIFDHPANRPRARWHVRDYGLFSANPFGDRAFANQKGGPGVSLEPGRSLTYRFALLVHPGDARTGEVARRYREYVESAKVEAPALP